MNRAPDRGGAVERRPGSSLHLEAREAAGEVGEVDEVEGVVLGGIEGNAVHVGRDPLLAEPAEAQVAVPDAVARVAVRVGVRRVREDHREVLPSVARRDLLARDVRERGGVAAFLRQRALHDDALDEAGEGLRGLRRLAGRVPLGGRRLGRRSRGRGRLLRGGPRGRDRERRREQQRRSAGSAGIHRDLPAGRSGPWFRSGPSCQPRARGRTVRRSLVEVSRGHVPFPYAGMIQFRFEGFFSAGTLRHP